MERMKPVHLRLSDEGLQDIADDEGFVGWAYDDADPKPPALKTFITDDNWHLVKGTLTIAHGHTRTVKPGMKVTREEALSLLRSDVRDAESCVHRFVAVPLTQGEFDGMADLFFNVGPGRMAGSLGPDDPGKDGIQCLGKSGRGRVSTLLATLNEGDYLAAANCFTQWRMPGSIFEWGLTKRRVKFMLRFLGLPIRRAVNGFPNAMPLGNAAWLAFINNAKRLAHEEKADLDGLAPPQKDSPAPTPQSPGLAPSSQASSEGGKDELVLDKVESVQLPTDLRTAPDVATRDVGAGSVEAASPADPVAPPRPITEAEGTKSAGPTGEERKEQNPTTANKASPGREVGPIPAASPAGPGAGGLSRPLPPLPLPPKNPMRSTTIWGGLFTALAPQLDQIGNVLMAKSAQFGAPFLVLGIIMIVLGRIGAVQPLSNSAPIRSQ